jgi:hypothetical protein
MRRVRVTIVLVWLVGVAVYAVVYAKRQLALGPPDEYARTWSFQLMAFALVRMPFLLAALGIMLWLSVRCCKTRTSEG